MRNVQDMMWSVYLWAESFSSEWSQGRADPRAALTSCFMTPALSPSPQGCERAADNKVPSPPGLQSNKPHEDVSWLGVIMCCMGVTVTHREVNQSESSCNSNHSPLKKAYFPKPIDTTIGKICFSTKKDRNYQIRSLFIEKVTIYSGLVIILNNSGKILVHLLRIYSKMYPLLSNELCLDIMTLTLLKAMLVLLYIYFIIHSQM